MLVIYILLFYIIYILFIYILFYFILFLNNNIFYRVIFIKIILSCFFGSYKNYIILFFQRMMILKNAHFKKRWWILNWNKEEFLLFKATSQETLYNSWWLYFIFFKCAKYKHNKFNQPMSKTNNWFFECK